jgi:glycosyltransferase involved in cell wall biosynthesis
VLVPPGRADPLARAVEEFVRNPARARAMGEAARRHALAHFSVESMADAYDRLYRDAKASA